MTTSTNKIAIRSFFVSVFIAAFIVAKAEESENMLSDNHFDIKASNSFKEHFFVDSPEIDLPFPISDGSTDPYNGGGSNVDFEDPLNFKREIVYDPITGEYVFRNSIGDDINNQPPYYMDMDEYRQYDMDRALENYWKSQIAEDNSAQTGGDAPKLDVDEKSFGDIFGSKLIQIVPQGSAELKFGVNTSKTDNPAIPVKQRSLTTFDFDQQIQLNVTGSIGDKLKINTSYNTEATFDFENQMKLGFEGNEDDIIQKVEAGHITYPISNSLIQGSQSLFGLRTDLKFGKLNISTVLSQQKGERKEINIKGGAQIQEYDLAIDNYEANKHYFVNHYHRGNFDNAMNSLPNVASQVRITRVEVWVTNRINDFEDTRNIVAFADLGEQIIQEGTPGPAPGSTVPGLPYNEANGLYPYISDPTNIAIRDLTATSTVLGAVGTAPGPFVQGQHYEKLENARLLSPQEYKFNSVLGYVSLNQSLNNDEILGVAYQYTYQGKTYQVGEFSTDGVDGKNALYLKLLRGTNNTPAYKAWDLMMKNIYSIGAYQISPTNFKLDVWYNNPKTGVDINYIPQPGVDDKLILQLVGSDILNAQNASFSDGVFDFVPLNYDGNKITNGGTINPQNGRIMFSKVEPFGSFLEQKLVSAGVTATMAKTIVYPQLYDSTKTKALQFPELNRFKIKGTYESSSSSEISLNAFNIPQGSVVVTAGGVKLIENQDYTVDYNLGRVKIINDGILNSGTPLKISLESNSLFSTVQKNLMGTHFDYKFSKNFNLGATMVRLSERPLTQKVNIGDEPIKNTMLGINGNFQSDAPFLTKLVDAIPFINTKEKSSISASLEAAYLIPGHSKAIGKEGNSYIDDFEGSQSTIDIRSFNTWVLASVPQGQTDLFPEASLNNDITSGTNRALINWNVIDPTVFHETNSNLAPNYIADDAIQHNNQMRQVRESEVFPNKSIDQTAGDIDRVAVFNLAYFPQERGPYNFDTSPNAISAGLDNNGLLNSPSTRWAGIMRQLQTNDFENANVEYIQFWVMDPFHSSSGNGTNDDSPNSTGGDLYFNLGNVSEDILKDGSKSFENGLTVDGTFDSTTMKTTNWGRVPTTQSIVNAFDNDVNTRQFQDVGLDGLSNTDEANFFSTFVTWVNGSSLSSAAKTNLLADPSGDDYTFYRDDNYDNAGADITERYKEFNGLEGNSPTNEQSVSQNADGYPTSKTTLPDIEDINRDNNLSETESYYQYKVSLRPADMQIGQNFIVDKVSRVHEASTKSVDWYQFKIPVRQPSKVVNGIQDFRSIRFMRIFMKEFSQPVVLRFARLELIRGTWRRFENDLIEPGEYIQNDPSGSVFNIGAVNIEENSNRQPIKYVSPPDIIRETNPNSAVQALLNEQSLELEVCGLKDGVGRAAFRNVEFDVLSYKKIKMFIHGEQHSQTTDVVNDDDVTVFIRLGSDFEYNYYEYEMPIKITQTGASSAEDIWPEANNLEVILQDLKNLKIARNNSLGSGASSLLSLFIQNAPNNAEHLIKVIGNPNLRGLRTIMVGVRNPHNKQTNPWKPDDGLEKCVKVWINELRMTDFDDQGGYAAQSRVQANLADFASVALAGHISTPGFGGIEQRVSDRQRETIKTVDASTNVQLGKFFGNKSGIEIPLYLGFSEGRIDPQFDPLNPDLEFKESVADLTPDEQLARKKASRDLTVRRSFNLSNVRINKKKKGAKPHPWDIKNFSASYSYNELYKRDIQTEYNTNRMYNGQLNYTFQTKAKPWTPFRNSKAIRKSKWLQLVRDFNVSPIPKQFAFRTNIDRTYNESKARDLTGNALIIDQFSKTFTWDRNYDLKWDLAKSLKIDYNANNNGFVGEPQDLRVNKKHYADEFEVVKDSVLQSLANFGENNHYAQTTNVTYAWPLRKIPLLNFINLNTKYSVSYDWQRAPLSQDSLGHTIQNSRNVSWNGNLNMINLYNKVPYLRKVNQKGRRRRPTKKPTYQKKGDKKAKLTAAEKKKEEEEKKNKKKDPNKLTLTDGFAKVLMSLKTVTFNYGINDGTLLPGYGEETEFFGLSNGFTSPGVPFVFGGEQERDIFGRKTNNDFAIRAASRDWLIGSSNRYITQQHTTSHSKKFNGRASFEPFKGIRLELTSNYNFAETMTENFMWDSTNTYNHLNTMRAGNFSVSYNSFRTSFIKDDSDGNSDLFTNLLNSRKAASELLSEKNPNSSTLESTGFYDGYGATQQDVVISSFLSAYSGKALTAKKTNPFSTLPAFNWRLTIDGLSRIEAVKKIFKSITFSHAYNSTFSVASFTTNLDAQQDLLGNQSSRDQANNIIPEQQILTVSITEQFSPLFKVDATWQNSLITKFEYKTNRNISLSLTNNQITELKGTEITIGTGYRFEKVELPFKLGKKKPVSDINARIDVSLRTNKTIIRKIVEEQNQLTAGQRYISIKGSADYIINKQFTLRFYYDRVMTSPFISTSFPTMNQNVGFALRINLFQ